MAFEFLLISILALTFPTHWVTELWLLRRRRLAAREILFARGLASGALVGQRCAIQIEGGPWSAPRARIEVQTVVVDFALFPLPEPGLAAAPIYRGLRRVWLGDPRLDRRYAVYGDEARIRALFSSALRTRLLGLPGRVRLAEGRFSLELIWSFRTLHSLRDFIAAAQRFSALLGRTELGLSGALLERLRDDPEPEVRRRTLPVLLDRFFDRPEAEEALAIALSDPDPKVRLLAAMRSGPRAGVLLAALARCSRLALPIRADALHALSRGADSETMFGLVRALLSEPRLVPALLKLIRRSRAARASEVVALHEEIARRYPESAPRVAESLSRLKSPAALPALLHLLDTAGSSSGRIAAIRAIARLGEPRGLASLQVAFRGRASGRERRELERAIRTLSRAGQHDLPGALSLAARPNDAIGALSLGEGGALSLCEKRRDATRT